jgi:hypothetical protein
MADVAAVEELVRSLDKATATLVRPVLARLSRRGGPGGPTTQVLQEFLMWDLPREEALDVGAQHEVAWALGDLYERAGLPEQAAVCRSALTHEALAVQRWVQSFGDVPEDFWRPALAALREWRDVPLRAALSLSSAQALLEVVGAGLVLADDGQLPAETVRALDDRFRWTEEFPWLRVTEEADLAPLRMLRAHLTAQRLLAEEGSLLVRTPLGDECVGDTGSLWRAVVDPSPRWAQEFERDALGVLAAAVLRSADFTLGRVTEEMTHVLASRWRAVSPAHLGSVFDGASAVAQGWYQLGVPLGWWDTGRGPADRRPNAFGQAAAVAVLRAVSRGGEVPYAR